MIAICRRLTRAISTADEGSRKVAESQSLKEIQHLRLAHDVDDRNRDAFGLQRRNSQIAIRRDVKIARAPTVDHVQRDRVVDRPFVLLRFDDFLSGQFVSCAPVSRREE